MRTEGRRTTRRSPTRVLLGLSALLALLAVMPIPSTATASLRSYTVANASTADPGDFVVYTLAINNTGPAMAARVWANVTYPPFTAYAGEGPPPMWTTGESNTTTTRSWTLANLPVDNHTWQLSLQILVGAPDQAVLTFRFTVDYTDEAGVLQQRTSSSASVRIVIPALIVTKTPSTDPVDPGQSFSYSVVIANAGSASSNTVWLNDTLPSQVTFTSVTGLSGCTPAPTTLVRCTVTNLAAGTNRTYSINVRVKTTAVRGTTFVDRLFVNFTDNDDTVLDPVSTAAYSDVRVIRDLAISKTVDHAYSFPGQTVAFTIWYNDTATGNLGATWLNDTLPAGMTHASSMPPGTVAGAAVRWYFSSVSSGPHTLQLLARIATTVADGTVLVNQVSGEYVNATGRKGQRVDASASVVVSADVPRFDFAKIASASTVPEDGTVRYTLYYNNTGTNTSAEVVIEDTIPQGTVLANPSEAAAATDGRRYTWRFATVPAGAHRVLSYELVLQSVTADNYLVNFAFLNFTDSLGGPLPPPGSRSAIVRVTAAGGGGPGPGDGGGGANILPFVVGGVVALAVAGVVGYRVMAGRKRTVIDEVFLLHRDGLLIKHYTRRVRPHMDSDILSGMLIAVQNFVNDSFLGSEGLQKDGTLDELRFGEFRILIERGQWVIVAAVLSGDPTNRVKAEVKAAIRDLEAALGADLDGWTGEMRRVEGADRFMQDLIGGKYRGARDKG